MKSVLLTTPCGPYGLGWGEDMMEVLRSRLARGHDGIDLCSELPTWALYLIAENLRNPCTVLEYPRWDKFIREIRKGYDVVAIELKSIHTARVVQMVKAVRTHAPKSEIVLGGYGLGSLYDPMPGDKEGYAEYLKSNVDHLCREEGVRFMRRLLGDHPVERPITQYELPYSRYHTPGVRSLSLKIPAILVALGCPSACDFCNTSAFYRHRKTYVADPEQTYAFMRHHQQRLGLEPMYVTLFDEDLFLDPEYVRQLGRLIRSDRKTWGIRYITFGSVKALSAFEVEELKECGVSIAAARIWYY